MTLIIKCLSGNWDRQLSPRCETKETALELTRTLTRAYAASSYSSSLAGLLDPLRPLGLLDPAGLVQAKSTYADAFDCIECDQNPHFWKTATQFTLRLPLLFDIGTFKTQAPAMLPSKNTNSGVGRNDFSLRQHCKIAKSI